LHVIHSFYPIQHKHEAMHLRTSTLVWKCSAGAVAWFS
jgi:hypothetical protein